MGLINPDFQTLPELFSSVFSHYRGKKDKFPIARKINGVYEPIPYEALEEDVQSFSAYLRENGIDRHDRVAILSENRPGWYLADMAILNLGAIDVPLYPSLPPNQIEYILQNCSAKGIVVSNMLQLGKILSIWQNLPDLSLVIVMNRLEEPVDDVIDLNNVKETGKKILAEKPWILDGIKVEPEDIATIIYTSGTTGLPKGVMLTHRNLCENVKSCSSVIRLDENDCSLSFLPLSHAYERTGGYYLLFSCGAAIYLAESIETISLNMTEAKPTIIFTVPRLFDRMKANMLKQVSSQSAVKQKIFNRAVKIGEEYHRQMNEKNRASITVSIQHKLADKLVYHKIRKKFGGRLRYFVSGGAALPQKIGEFFQALEISILEGFGLTETSPVTNVNRPEKIKFGTVGPVVNNVQVRIAEDGEILIKGPNIMKGYWQDEVATKEVIRDGWFYSGDIGVLDSDGYLKITDRKKHIIVTSGGKNIAPQPIENLITDSPYVDQVIVIGEKRPFLIAVIVPDFAKLNEYAAAHSIAAKTSKELIEYKDILQIYEKIMRTISRQLATHEKVRKFLLIEEAFSIEKGDMTPTMKLKRKAITEKYAQEIDKVYNALNMVYNTE
ncbi:MAG: long-chain fatty acid--CoA ligase [Chlorobium sp.]|uniref:AMP-dependent synthetase/ligase n=1 Tax=Chlorobium sp. TaxID=1095 RepID=UPI0025C27B53|nr:long-chain fatty acid--CoA ligase [Chlorobium sp.]MCF8216213.1 long-chain fatty acid--CoA ligase [Chlorobium sp.]MCF8271115.1 long-chain fatty acid--CoA ligase [Chlorobium sp.]MCF8287489.1 long-chain fatty acid--CoA ligase [Chlorobium sp.]MCF8291028.1 long-chain fatty acid--CoA ligase [Chlorobium sp.]MCF8385123.1 long-chain fatty acid--CoA ligase [Chlorobium sp.]